MQANLFKILAIVAVFSTVQSAPVETAEGQVTETRNRIYIKGIECYKKDPAPPISVKEKEGDIFRGVCFNYTCWHHDQCIARGCRECNIYFNDCGDEFIRCY
ncbi:uncharacterized protein B0I36DRAFT_361779 [Microdochium trichocladiopsis]|uniref:Uncharacterized protein n=1 Tax=Microdochium trichocladiopsis TaxID=1682393 RepID=A0A9P9BV83_9PEZI|nr:uncharacterized protein B0I36DRAFT_361779 [Microdochium trichocladiopsis]KAH7033057.1 hypothetical protein B0I36DRAFT_361779 [Microdochium trichocladiopsis]